MSRQTLLINILNSNTSIAPYPTLALVVALNCNEKYIMDEDNKEFANQCGKLEAINAFLGQINKITYSATCKYTLHNIKYACYYALIALLILMLLIYTCIFTFYDIIIIAGIVYMCNRIRISVKVSKSKSYIKEMGTFIQKRIDKYKEITMQKDITIKEGEELKWIEFHMKNDELMNKAVFKRRSQA